MIGLNDELAQREAAGQPVRIGMIGAGTMGTDVVAQTTQMKGVRMSIVADIRLERAREAYRIAGITDEVVEAKTAAEADAAAAAGKRVVTADCRVVSDMRGIDVLLEATGVPEIGSRAVLRAARMGHQIAMMNVETDITVGPLLKWYCDRKGVLYGLAAGDEPAATKELWDFAEALGFTIVAAGKGKNNLLDIHAKPTDEYWAREAARRGQSANMLIEFVDGSKTMVEMAAVSNATGLVPDVRGMHHPLTDREHLNQAFALARDGGCLNKPGCVEFAIGKVAPGVFLIVSTDHPRLREAMVLRDMGPGPYYTLFRPYHLCSIEVPLTCAMLAIRGKSNMFPLPRLVSEVFATAKQDLKPGDTLDGIGRNTFYGLIDRHEVCRAERLLPLGLAEGAKVIRPLAIDQPISYDDVKLREPSNVWELRKLQDAWMHEGLSEDVLYAEVEKLARD